MRWPWLMLGILLAFTRLAWASDEPAKTRLEALSNDPARADSREEIDALAKEVDLATDSETRAVADLFLADAYRGRFGDARAAAKHFRRVVDSPHADGLMKRVAEGGLFDSLVASGARKEAVAFAAHSADAGVRARGRAIARRGYMHNASIAALVIFAIGATLGLARAARSKRLPVVLAGVRRFLPLALGFAAWVGGAGALLARAYDGASPAPFAWLSAVSFAIAVAARAWGLASEGNRAVRIARALTAAPAALAGAFLILETLDPSYLGGFGL